MSLSKKRKKKRTALAVSVLVILLIILGVLAYAYMLLENINYREITDDDAALGITPAPDTEEGETIPRVTNIVLFGLDKRDPDEASRTDSIIVVSLDGNHKKIKITSFMRDMYVTIPGEDDGRINAAYTYGGAPLAIKTINSNFGLDIRNYVAVDFIGLEKIIDKVGGVEVNVKSGEVKELNRRVQEVAALEGVKNPPTVKKAGLQILDGRQAVAYARIRKVGNADYERTQRQRNVLNSLYRKVKSQGIAKLPGTVSGMLPYVETSLKKTQIMQLAIEVAGYDADALEQLRLPVDGGFTSKSIKGMQVLVPDIELNTKLLHQFIYDVE